MIGVLGQFNKGKTYLLQKISAYDINHGYSESTIGLSVKFPSLDYKNRMVTVLDSAGFETPILLYNDKNN